MTALSAKGIEAASQVRLSSDAGPQPALSAARKRFNSLVKRLEDCRGRLHAWGEALPRWRERYHEQAVPLFRRRAELDLELLRLLDHAHASYKLGKAERAFLSELIRGLAGPLVEQGGADIKDMYDRHSDVGFDKKMAESDQLIRQAVAAHFFGLDPDEMQNVDSAEALFERLREREQEREAHEQQRDERAKARRVKRKQPAEEAAPPPQPLRELYRKLATALHPDREPDPVERERKTALMQRVNQAYSTGNLLALIELQLEIGQLRPEQMQQMSEDRIKQYNQDLGRQLKEIENELVQVEESFRADYGLFGGNRLDPKRLDAVLARTKRELTSEIHYIEDDLYDLQTPAIFKRWLKQQRQLAEHRDALSGGFDGQPW
jgi:hypothetical protein